jgi:hypothetical protein
MFMHLKRPTTSLPATGRSRGPVRGLDSLRERPLTGEAESKTIEWVVTEGPHRHVVSVGIATVGAPSREMLLGDVLDALAAGQLFCTHRPGMPAELPVARATCRFFDCEAETIRSDPDEMTDNNLDVLPHSAARPASPSPGSQRDMNESTPDNRLDALAAWE